MRKDERRVVYGFVSAVVESVSWAGHISPRGGTY